MLLVSLTHGFSEYGPWTSSLGVRIPGPKVSSAVRGPAQERQVCAQVRPDMMTSPLCWSHVLHQASRFKKWMCFNQRSLVLTILHRDLSLEVEGKNLWWCYSHYVCFPFYYVPLLNCHFFCFFSLPPNHTYVCNESETVKIRTPDYAPFSLK